MKVEVTSEVKEQAFQPIEVKLTFETENEAQAMRSFWGSRSYTAGPTSAMRFILPAYKEGVQMRQDAEEFLGRLADALELELSARGKRVRLG